jgi:hypothetical protein
MALTLFPRSSFPFPLFRFSLLSPLCLPFLFLRGGPVDQLVADSH